LGACAISILYLWQLNSSGRLLSVVTVNALVYGQYELSFKLILIKRRHSSLLKHYIDTLLMLLRIYIYIYIYKITYNFVALVATMWFIRFLLHLIIQSYCRIHTHNTQHTTHNTHTHTHTHTQHTRARARARLKNNL